MRTRSSIIAVSLALVACFQLTPPGFAQTPELPDSSGLDSHQSAWTPRCPEGIDCRILDVELDAQEHGNWCWATSGQMILDYMGTEVAQCDQANDKWGNAKGVDCCDSTHAEHREICTGANWPRFKSFGFTGRNTKYECRRKYLKEREWQRRLPNLPRWLEAAVAADGELSAFDQAALKSWIEGNDDEGKANFDDDCALNWEAIKREIDANRPFAFSWKYANGSAHMMVAIGYVELPPGDRPGDRWVVVNNPWPPNNADASLMTYEHYVGGPDGRHYRDIRAVRARSAPSPVTGEDDLVTFASLQAAEKVATEALSPPLDHSQDYEVGIGFWFAKSEDPAERKRVAAMEAALPPAMRVIERFIDLPKPPPFMLPMPAPGNVEEELVIHIPGYLEVASITLADLNALVDEKDNKSRELEVKEVLLPVFRSDFGNNDHPRDALRTAVTLQRQGDAWRAVSIGRSTLVHSVHDILELIHPGTPSLGFLFSGEGDEALRTEPLRLIHQQCCYEIYLEDPSGPKLYALYDQKKTGFEHGKEIEDPLIFFSTLIGCAEDCAPRLGGEDESDEPASGGSP